MTTFECLGCGDCCKNLIETKNGFKSGMLLTENEKSLFSEADISPAYCVDDKVILWQLNKAVCPNLSKTGCGCLIYLRRPVVCRAFPVVNDAVSINCGAADSFNSFSREREEADRLKRYVEYRTGKAKMVLRYDLALNQWRRA